MIVDDAEHKLVRRPVLLTQVLQRQERSHGQPAQPDDASARRRHFDRVGFKRILGSGLRYGNSERRAEVIDPLARDGPGNEERLIEGIEPVGEWVLLPIEVQVRADLRFGDAA
jgi:hypothetical protein